MLDEMTDEEKARVLRRHLVSREERAQVHGDASSSRSDSGQSMRSSQAIQREETEPFPVPYHAPGADIT